jgi:hypothetical protein
MIFVCNSKVVNLFLSATKDFNAHINAEVNDAGPGWDVFALLPQAAMSSKLLLE